MLRDAIISAARAERNDGKRHSHQWRITRATVTQAERAMIAAEHDISKCQTFDDLHELIRKLFLPIHGAGVLFIYDTAFRLGQFLKLYPTKVYLHAGTRTGAANLGLPSSGAFLQMNQLPAELQRLSPADIEDFLCVCKAHLHGGRRIHKMRVC